MITVKHWKRAGYACKHTANSTEGALLECLRCRGLSLAGIEMLTPILERTGEVKFVAGKESFIFRTVSR